MGKTKKKDKSKYLGDFYPLLLFFLQWFEIRRNKNLLGFLLLFYKLSMIYNKNDFIFLDMK